MKWSPFSEVFTAQKVSVFGVSLVHIFLHSDWKRSFQSKLQSKCKDLQSKPPYSVQMRENADQGNSKYGHFLQNDWLSYPKTCWEYVRGLEIDMKAKKDIINQMHVQNTVKHLKCQTSANIVNSQKLLTIFKKVSS